MTTPNLFDDLRATVSASAAALPPTTPVPAPSVISAGNGAGWVADEPHYDGPADELDRRRRMWNSIKPGRNVRGVQHFVGLQYPAREDFTGRINRKEVTWTVYRELRDVGITSYALVKDYNPDNVVYDVATRQVVEELSTYGKMVEERKQWVIRIYKTDDPKVGEIKMFGPARKIPSVLELGSVLFELSKKGLFVTQWHENTGMVVRGKPIAYDGYAVESHEDWVKRYKKALARATSTLGNRVREQLITKAAKYGTVNGDFLSKAIDKVVKPPQYNPENLWGYGRKNRDIDNGGAVLPSTEAMKLDISFRFPCSKAKGSKKRSKGGGGGAYRIGTESKVQREFARLENHPKCIAGIVSERVNAVMAEECDDQFEKPQPGRIAMIKEVVERLDAVKAELDKKGRR